MKKILIYSTLFLSVIFCSKEKAISEYTKNSELIAQKESVKPEQKLEFYKQFAKNQLVDDMKNYFSYKNYPDELLRTFADTILTYDNSRRFYELSTVETINQLDKYLGDNSKNEEFTKHRISLLGDYPSVVKAVDGTEHTAFEVVPKEIFEIFFWGGGALTTQNYFKINGKSIENLQIIPTSDEFYNKVGKQIKSDQFDFYDGIGRSSTRIKKDNKDKYIVSSLIYINGQPSFHLEYTTKDFKNFVPLRTKLNDENSKWTNF